MPTIMVSSTRKATMYSFTRFSTAPKLDSTQSGVRKVDSRTNSSEMPSTPT